ncbi:ATP-dependent Clp protease, ATP-binding subunit, putative [Streptococcus pneumoniae SP9-BS68]|nr:ATP-dependent Clp protease, ATP-binding subunit, putative [Streptococcus pneumoniae SP9-BS68]
MPQQASGMKQDGVLAKLGRNLTAEAREGKLDPVIGRNKEIQETSEILSRRTKTILFWSEMQVLVRQQLSKV